MESSVRADVFAAISAPARRAILMRLQTGELPVLKLAESFDMSLPAVSQHLAVLKSAGLVRVRKRGRQRFYALDAEPLKSISEWVSQYETFWTERLQNLGEYLKENE